MTLKAPKRFKQFSFTFNDYSHHTLKSRLKRVKLSNRKFKKSLYPMMLKIEDNYFEQGTYGFVFNEFTIIADWCNNRLNVITLLKSKWRNNMKDLKVKYKVEIKNFYR